MPRTSAFSLDVLSALLDAEERARVDGYALRDDGGGVDAFGVSRRALARGFAAGRFVHQSLISVRAVGLEAVPVEGPAILAVASQRPSALDLLAAVVESSAARRHPAWCGPWATSAGRRSPISAPRCGGSGRCRTI